MLRAAPRHRAADAVTAVLTLSVAAGATVVAAPGWFGLAGERPLVWLVPFRVPLGLGLAGAAGLTALVGLTGRRRRRALPAAAVLAVVAAASLTATAQRGLAAGELPPAREGDVTVLAANVLHARADRAAVADLAVRTGAQVLSLPESTAEYAREVAERVQASSGRRLQVFFSPDGGDGEEGTALLVDEALGEYRATDDFAGSTTAVTTAVPVSGEGPPLAAAHTAAPVPHRMAAWRREVPAVAQWCARTPGALLAGDLNATLDHPGMRLPGTCVDAGAATGTGARGTWPSGAPAALGATIDHALADGAAWRAVGSAVRDVAGSDHRALVVRWRPARAA
ncbi:endonuclease/exonuclease/phosphatase family protein [Kineococcus gypseus]|uniref:endonuclease/exonuclease/phosphatase family protein n=1 Tax=Kineococcus gypseus TaxID=1637102 RepID=UPI003D7DA3B1